MEQAAINERNRKAEAAAEENRKRTMAALSEEASEAKRLKTEHSSAGVGATLANIDFDALPPNLVADLVIANLQAIPQETLLAAIQVR